VGGERGSLAERLAGGFAADENLKAGESEGEGEEDNAGAAMAAEQLEECDSGCECGPEEAEGESALRLPEISYKGEMEGLGA